MSRSRRSTSDTGYISGGSYSPRKDDVFDEELETEYNTEQIVRVDFRDKSKIDFDDEGRKIHGLQTVEKIYKEEPHSQIVKYKKINFDIGDKRTSPEGLKEIAGIYNNGRGDNDKEIWLPPYYRRVSNSYQQPAEGFENPEGFSKDERPGITPTNPEATMLNKILSWWFGK